jgi:putative nucleotidyltransferase with HDIG domain
MQLTVEQVVNGLYNLPALPGIVAQVIRLTDDPYSTVQELDSIICQDQALTANVLRLANSAYYGYPRHIATIIDAIGILGFNTIRDLVFVASVNKMLIGKAVAGIDIWRHSITCAMTARAVARRVHFKPAGWAFIAGLLHDIGKIALGAYMKDAYDELLLKAREELQPESRAEEEALGITHAAVGSRLAENWNLPHDFVEAIAYHHEPLKATENPRLTAIVHLANSVLISNRLDPGEDGYIVEPRVLSLFDLDTEDMKDIISELAELMGGVNILLMK